MVARDHPKFTVKKNTWPLYLKNIIALPTTRNVDEAAQARCQLRCYLQTRIIRYTGLVRTNRHGRVNLVAAFLGKRAALSRSLELVLCEKRRPIKIALIRFPSSVALLRL